MDYQPKKKKRPINKRRRWLFITLVLGIVVCAVGIISAILFSCNYPSREIFDATTIDVEGEAAIPQIERALEAPLPESATNIHFYYTSWLDYFMQIRFDLPRADVEGFLDSIRHMCFDAMPRENNYMSFNVEEGRKSWWNTYRAEVFVGTEQCGDNPYWEFLIDQTDDDVWIVYIVGFST